MVILPLIIAIIFFILLKRLLDYYISDPIEEEYYYILLRDCLGDRDLAERLIEVERRQHPNAARLKLIQLAIERLKTHRR